MTESRKKRGAARIKARRLYQLSQAHATPLEQELLQLVDGLAEYTVINAFLCRSFTSVLSVDEAAREDVVQGAKYFSDFLQRRLLELRYELELVRERHSRGQTQAKVRR